MKVTLPDGEAMWLDTRFSTLAAGELVEDLAGATAMVLRSDGLILETVPQAAPERFLRVEERRVELPEPGRESLTVRVERRLAGADGHRRKAEIAAQPQLSRRHLLEEELAEAYPGLAVTAADWPGLADPGPVVERFDFTAATGMEARTDGAPNVAWGTPLALSPALPIAAGAAAMERRTTAFHLRTECAGEDRIEFVLPPGARFVDSRLPAAEAIPSRFGVYQLRVEVDEAEGVLTVRRRYVFGPQRISASDWPDFRAVLERMRAAEAQWVEWTVMTPP